MIKIKILATIAIFIFLLSSSLFAQDLDKSDPLRKTIMNSIRESKHFSYLENSKFDVRRVWASNTWAYLCALPIASDGSYHQTDDAYDFYQVILFNNNQKWEPIAEIGEFAESPKMATCILGKNKKITDSIIKKLSESKDAVKF